MKAVESLILEHQLIARLADALETYAQQTGEGRPPDAAHLRLFAAAFTDFAECIHHEKEESILLPMLVRHGVRWDTGALPCVRRDHRQETYLIEVLRQAGERAVSWHAEERRHIAAAAQALVDSQRHHHALETSALFPLLATHLQARTSTSCSRRSSDSIGGMSPSGWQRSNESRPCSLVMSPRAGRAFTRWGRRCSRVESPASAASGWTSRRADAVLAPENPPTQFWQRLDGVSSLRKIANPCDEMPGK
jgi:hemerythrin-like domain-containing protein